MNNQNGEHGGTVVQHQQDGKDAFGDRGGDGGDSIASGIFSKCTMWLVRLFCPTAGMGGRGGAPGERGQDGASGCFTGQSLVCLSDGAEVKMKELRIGQSLMTLDEEGSPSVTTFLGWLHRDTNLEAEFLEITTEDGHKITLTPSHIIMVNSDMKLASQVTIGDQLLSKTGPVVVLTIERVITRGVYSPLTTSSTVLVSGVLCSCFAATNHNNIAQGMVTNYHIQAHTCFAPVRALPSLLEDNYSQDKDGVRGYPLLLQGVVGLLSGAFTWEDEENNSGVAVL